MKDIVHVFFLLKNHAIDPFFVDVEFFWCFAWTLIFLDFFIFFDLPTFSEFLSISSKTRFWGLVVDVTIGLSVVQSIITQWVFFFVSSCDFIIWHFSSGAWDDNFPTSSRIWTVGKTDAVGLPVKSKSTHLPRAGHDFLPIGLTLFFTSDDDLPPKKDLPKKEEIVSRAGLEDAMEFTLWWEEGLTCEVQGSNGYC